MPSKSEQALASYELARWLRNTAQAERANARPPKADQGEGR